MATATTLQSESQSTPAEPDFRPDFRYEVIDGRIVERPPMGVFEGWLASRLERLINDFHHGSLLGTVCHDILFTIDRVRNRKRCPDMAFVSRERWPIDRSPPRIPAWDVIPDLMVEIVSPTNSGDEIVDKIAEYFAAGVRLVWVIYPSQRQVYVYDSPVLVQIFSVDDTLDGGAVLPGFELPLVELFGAEADATAEKVQPPRS